MFSVFRRRLAFKSLRDIQFPPRRNATSITTSTVTSSSKRGKKWWGGATFIGTAALVTAYTTSVVLGDERKKKEKIVVLGSGWAGLSCIKELDTKRYDVTIVSPTNYFLFTPLLPSVTVGTLDPRSIIEPIRRFCKRTNSEDVTYLEATCMQVDPATNTIQVVPSNPARKGEPATITLPYDKLVCAVGSVNNTFGTPGVEENCFFLKSIKDAVSIRARVIDCLESASLTTDKEEKAKLLTFCIVGGGPAGVEVAAELHDFFGKQVRRYYPEMADLFQIVVVEMSEKLLNTYDGRIADYTKSHFQRSEIDVKTGHQVVAVKADSVTMKNLKEGTMQDMPYGLCVWCTGIGTSPLVQQIRAHFPAAQMNRRALVTDGHLKLLGSDNIYALGDVGSIDQARMRSELNEIFQELDTSGDGCLSLVEFQRIVEKYKKKYPQIELYGKGVEQLFAESDVDKDGSLSLQEFSDMIEKVDRTLRPLPCTAQVAEQQGMWLGRHFNKDEKSDHDFEYKHTASLAYIGGHEGVVEFPGGYVFKGFSTFMLWRGIYLSKQFSLRNKTLVCFDWCKTLLFGRDCTRE